MMFTSEGIGTCRMSSKLIILIVTLVLSALVMITVGSVVVANQQPNCPTEDSCSIDYRDGEWHIEERQP